MKIIAIITARSDSSRLRRKVLIPIHKNLNSLDIIYNRLKQSKKLDDIIMATSNEINDDEIEALAKKKTIMSSEGKKGMCSIEFLKQANYSMQTSSYEFRVIAPLSILS